MSRVPSVISDPMTAWINATGIATVLTALFALRFRTWRSPRILALYFIFFFSVEFAVTHWLLPEDAFGPEIGFVCLGISALVFAAIAGLDWYERQNGEDR